MNEIWTIKRTAQQLDLSANGVRWLVSQGRLACTQTADGLRLFDANAVKELAQKRAEGKSSLKKAA